MPNQYLVDPEAFDSRVTRIVQEELSKTIQKELDAYFKNQPFMVEQQQHYDDHHFIHSVRQDMSDVKRSFLQKIGTMVALLVTGAFGWKFVRWLFTPGS